MYLKRNKWFILLKDIIYNDGDGKEISNALNNLKKIDKDGKFGFK